MSHDAVNAAAGRNSAAATAQCEPHNLYLATRREGVRRPSLILQFPAFILFTAMVADSARYADYDLWGHIVFGNDVLRHGHAVLRDHYSYSAPGGLYLDHEWLAQVIIAASFEVFGVVGLKLLKFLGSLGTIVFLAMAQAETGASLLVQMGTLTIASLVLIVQMQFRPQLFTFVLMAALLWLLARENYRGHSPVWLTVPLMALWANLHGGFVAGLGVLGVYGTVAAAQDVLRGKGWRRGLLFAGVTASGAAATLLTPYGIYAWQAFTHTVAGPRLLERVVEWEPLLRALRRNWGVPHSGETFLILAMLMIAVAAAAVILHPHGGDLPLIAVALVADIPVFVSVRNIALGVIATALPITRHLHLLGRGERDAESSEFRISIPVQAAVAVLALALGVRMGLFSTRLPDLGPMPWGAVTFMHQNDLRGNILCDYDWGEYIIYQGAPRLRVFIDGRYQVLYPPEVIGRYFEFARGGPNAARVLEEYAHDFVLVRTGSAAHQLMVGRADWKLVYDDAEAALFARSTSPLVGLSAGSTPKGNSFSYFPR